MEHFLDMRNYIKVARAKHSLTQKALANIVGVTRQTILAIEKGKYVPSTILALKLAKHLGEPVESLFELEEQDERV